MVYSETEAASRDDLTALQSERLAETVARAYENVPFYRDALDERGVSPDDIEHVDDVSSLPFTTKEDFRDNYPDGLFAVPNEEILRLHASSGTTGKPKVVGYTDGDLGVWREVMARSLHAAGIDPGDTVQNAYGYGLFTGGLGMHDGIQELGATVVPTGSGNTRRQIEMMQDIESDALACTPSYCLYLAECAEEMGIDPRSLPISTVVIGAEPFTDPMREEIEEALDVTAIDVYGLSEIIGPGVSIECAECQDGMHVWEDHFYPEIIDSSTGEVLPEGEEGELVITSLTKEALPVLRYRTGDITSLNRETCDCGRTAVRMDNVRGRSDDLLIVRGVNVYPSQIEEVLLEFDGFAPHYRIDLDREGTMDTIEITVERHESFDGDADELEADALSRLRDVLQLNPDGFDVADPDSIERTEVGKVKRVFDHRE